MKTLLSILVAAAFSAVSFSALAADTGALGVAADAAKTQIG
ncbi:hypothetical protein [Cupriavidus necator]|nr:hypothetical protein [Cupriavidus necator]